MTTARYFVEVCENVSIRNDIFKHGTLRIFVYSFSPNTERKGEKSIFPLNNRREGENRLSALFTLSSTCRRLSLPITLLMYYDIGV